MQKSLLQLSLGLGCVFSNTLFSTVFTHPYANSCLAQVDKTDTKPLWHPALKVGPREEKPLELEPPRQPDTFPRPKGWPAFEVGPNQPILEKLLIKDRGLIRTVHGDFLDLHAAPASVRKPEEPVLKKTLNDASFRKMINLRIPEDSRDQWARSFGEIETEAAAQLCVRVNGLSKSAVVKLLGPPAFRAPSVLCFDKQHDETYRLYRILGGAAGIFDAMDDNWLYFFGGRPMLIRPMFSDGICTGATANNFDGDSLYNNWRSAQLHSFAVGKKVAEIIALAGQPNHEFTKETAKSARKIDPQLLEALKSADDMLSYQFGKSSADWLLIKDGRCFYACKNPSIAIMTGGKIWDHEEYQATFKKPTARAVLNRP